MKLASSRLNSKGSKVCKQAGEVNKELAWFLENFSHVRTLQPTCLTVQTQHAASLMREIVIEGNIK